MNTVHIERSIDAPVSEVWNVAGNFLKSPGGDIHLDVLNDGNPDNNHVGAERNIGNGKVSLIERLDSMDPMHNFTYSVLSGFLPVKDYHGKVEFTPEQEATEIIWDTTYKAKYPGSGWLVKIIVKKILNQYLDEVENNINETH